MWFKQVFLPLWHLAGCTGSDSLIFSHSFPSESWGHRAWGLFGALGIADNLNCSSSSLRWKSMASGNHEVKWKNTLRDTGTDFSILLVRDPKLAAAAAAKSLQSCPSLCDPIDGSPPGSPVPGILQGRTLEWVAIPFSTAWKWRVKVKSLSRVRLSDPMDCSPPGSSVHGIFQARVLEWGVIAFSGSKAYQFSNLRIPNTVCPSLFSPLWGTPECGLMETSQNNRSSLRKEYKEFSRDRKWGPEKFSGA